VGQGISTAKHRDVAEVQGDGVDADQHLAPLQPRIVFLLQAKIIQAREVIQAVGFHRGISSERKRIVSRRRPGNYIDAPHFYGARQTLSEL
jgi:hypothetical protein